MDGPGLTSNIPPCSGGGVWCPWIERSVALPPESEGTMQCCVQCLWLRQYTHSISFLHGHQTPPPNLNTACIP
jgi:hypothetical protein